MLKFISMIVGAEITWCEIVLGIALSCLFYVGLVVILSI